MALKFVVLFAVLAVAMAAPQAPQQPRQIVPAPANLAPAADQQEGAEANKDLQGSASIGYGYYGGSPFGYSSYYSGYPYGGGFGYGGYGGYPYYRGFGGLYGGYWY